MQVALAQPNNLKLHFDSGVDLNIDTSTLKMTPQQQAALEKLVQKAKNIPVAQCVNDRCPAQEFLSADEFAQVRSLKATLGDVADGLIADFCLHVVKVG